ncbi:hypothetical protein OOZ51_16185 [Arthrobacter sp. MI7-26]|uniref:hypothetical protein n=1 Tax=Arthrobacter sp. MI7-26 TaxID=2993653 RepID=UPI0022499798|nr:hypothetical protein [Arthrobacter sp. MI7-26]MCX2749338.1 hypothetical protein [Arthrobacter sp. MI7-26]
MMAVDVLKNTIPGHQCLEHYRRNRVLDSPSIGMSANAFFTIQCGRIQGAPAGFHIRIFQLDSALANENSEHWRPQLTAVKRETRCGRGLWQNSRNISQ